MDSSLRVDVNREGVRSVTPAERSVSVDGPFDLSLENHGPATHVHVAMDDALAAVASVPEVNYYVEAESTTTVPIDVESLEAVEGRLEFATGYGAERSVVEVHVAAGSGGVEVGEEVTKVPAPDPDAEEDTSYLPAAFVGFGVVVVAAVALLVDDLAAMTLGIAAVVLAVAAALYVLLWS
ncbi:MAG: hypothetical protein ABEJ59_05220 [Halanaeroarchaeum sp.]